MTPPAAAPCGLRSKGWCREVGFVPFVHRLASSLALAAGWIEQPHPVSAWSWRGRGKGQLASFRGALLDSGAPSHKPLDRLERSGCQALALRPDSVASRSAAPPAARQVHRSGAADLAPAPNLPGGAVDPFQPPLWRLCFTSCAHCGPRFQILRALRSSRRHTSLASFFLCACCAGGFTRSHAAFHAQDTGCRACGPA